MEKLLFIIIILFLFSQEAHASTTHHKKTHKKPIHHTQNIQHTQSIPTSELESYEQYPLAVKKLVVEALQLAKQNLSYKYGSDNPQNKGMDCSGTVNYMLKKFQVYEVPRASDEIYEWAAQKGDFHPVNTTDFNSDQFSNLQPGDLLFWTGAHQTRHSARVTHVMIYLGKNQDEKPLMFGASTNHHYRNKKIWGVSVFDFNPALRGFHGHFVGYGCIPDLTCGLPMAYLSNPKIKDYS